MTAEASSPDPDGAPREAYRRLRDARAASAEALRRRAAHVSNARLAVFVLAVAAAFLVFGRQSLPIVVLVLLATGFLALVVWHDVLLRRLQPWKEEPPPPAAPPSEPQA